MPLPPGHRATPSSPVSVPHTLESAQRRNLDPECFAQGGCLGSEPRFFLNTSPLSCLREAPERVSCKEKLGVNFKPSASPVDGHQTRNKHHHNALPTVSTPTPAGWVGNPARRTSLLVLTKPQGQHLLSVSSEGWLHQLQEFPDRAFREEIGGHHSRAFDLGSAED